MYLRTKFQVSSKILTSFSQEGNFTAPSFTLVNRTRKKFTQISVKIDYYHKILLENGNDGEIKNLLKHLGNIGDLGYVIG